MTIEQLEIIFKEFQSDEAVQNEKHRALGIFIRLTNPDNEKDVYEMSDQLDNLVQCSEKQGFKNGFKAAFLMLSNSNNASTVETTDYLETVDLIEKS